jgi:hypothetical protein
MMMYSRVVATGAAILWIAAGGSSSSVVQAQAPAAAPAAAQTASQPPASAPAMERINLTAGRSTVLTTDFDITRIAVTNPAVADATVVAAREDGSLPVGEAVDLASELGLEVAHEAGDLPSILGHGEKVNMRGERSDSAKGEVMVSLTSAEGAEDDVVERRPGPEKESALDGAAGDEDEGTGFGEVSEFSGSTCGARASPRP